MKNDFIGIMVEHTPGLLVSLIAVLKSGNYIVPLNTGFPDNRIHFIIEDCKISVLLTDNANYARALEISQSSAQLRRIICIDNIDYSYEIEKKYNKTGTGKKEYSITSDQWCYVIYTSGSTGQPKGVPITHANLNPLMVWSCNYYKLGRSTRVLQTLSYSFDFGIFELFSTILFGSILYFFNKNILIDYLQYLEFIERHKINTIHTTPSFFNQIVNLEKKIPSLRILHYGGEPLHTQTISKVFQYLHQDCMVYNGYGPTEVTINSSIFAMKVADGLNYILESGSNNIPIGRPSANNVVYITNHSGHPMPIGIPGELCISGAGVAQGYLNQPQLTASKFVSNPYSPYQLMYCTGDVVKWRQDSNIEFLGRQDDQVKIRGFRVEIGEIENKLRSINFIKEAIVVLKKMNNESDDHEAFLCAYIISKVQPLPISDIKEKLAKELPDYMIPPFFIAIQAIPMTPNGKVDKKALPSPNRSIQEEIRSPENSFEERLVDLWAQILGIDKTKISIEDNFFNLGGHSLKAISLISAIHKNFNTRIPLAELFSSPSLKEMALLIQDAFKEQYCPVRPGEKREYYPVSPAQKRLFIIQQMDNTNTTYNLPMTLVLTGDLRTRQLERVFHTFIHRHEGFRTSFHFIENEPVQRIHDQAKLQIDSFTIDSEKDETIIVKNFVRPFDLSTFPLFRIGLINIESNKHILMIDMHHIISDGISLLVLVKEFHQLYDNHHLPPLSVQYRDYSLWLRSCDRKEMSKIKKQEAYWMQQFSDTIPLLNLPLDYPRSEVRCGDGDIIEWQLSRQWSQTLKEYAQKRDVTLFMVLLAVFVTLLAKYSGQEDFVVGVPSAGRGHADLENIIGMFVNMLPIRNRPKPDITFRHLLETIKRNSLDAFENQYFQFDQLINKLNLQGDTSRNVLLDAVFQFQNADNIDYTLIEGEYPLQIVPSDIRHKVAHFDLYLAAYEGKEAIGFYIEYSTTLFKRETIEKMTKYFVELLEQVFTNDAILLKNIKMSHGFVAIETDIDSMDDYQLEF